MVPRQIVSHVASAPVAISRSGRTGASAPKMTPGKQVSDQMTRTDRRGLQAIENRTRRRGYVDGAKRSLVMGHVRRECGLGRKARIRVRVVEDEVDPVPALRRGAGEIDRQLFAVHGDRDR